MAARMTLSILLLIFATQSVAQMDDDSTSIWEQIAQKRA